MASAIIELSNGNSVRADQSLEDVMKLISKGDLSGWLRFFEPRTEREIYISIPHIVSVRPSRR